MVQRVESSNLIKTTLKLNIHIVNIDVPTNIQNVLRSHFEQIRDEILKRSSRVQQIRKDIVYINNREMRPIDGVLRMNPSPDVALIGWPFTPLSKANAPSINIARARFSEDPRLVKYKKAFNFHQLDDTITVLVGDIKNILLRTVQNGFDVRISILTKTKEDSNLQNLDSLMAEVDKIKSFDLGDDETEEFNIDSENELNNFFSIYGLDKIHSLHFLGLRFRALINLYEEENEYVIQNQIFNQTFLKIWNIETSYRSTAYVNDVNTFSLLSRFNPILVVLPPPILGMLNNFFILEGQQKLFTFENLDQVMANVEQLNHHNFKGVLCLLENKDSFRSLSFCSNAAIFWIDELIPNKLLEKILKINIDLSDQEKFNSLSRSIKVAIEQIPNQYPAAIQKYIPVAMGEFLMESYQIIEAYTSAMFQGELNKKLSDRLQGGFRIFQNLEKEYGTKSQEIEVEVQAIKAPIQEVVANIQGKMARMKELESEIHRLATLNETGENTSIDKLAAIEAQENQLKAVAKKQYELAEVLGAFIRDTLRANLPSLMNAPKSEVSSNFLKIKRNVFNFNPVEWQYLYGRKIYFLTSHNNVNRLLNTLIKAESIPENDFIQIIIPDSNASNVLERADWLFYDLSVPNELVARYNAFGRSRFVKPQFNEVLTKTETAKTQFLRTLAKLQTERITHDNEKITIEEKLIEFDQEFGHLRHEVLQISKRYQKQLAKYRQITQVQIQYNQFRISTYDRLKTMHEGLQKLGWLNEGSDTQNLAWEQQKIAKHIAILGDIFSTFYKSLVSIKFIAQTLENFTKVTKNFRFKIALKTIETGKLRFKLKAVKNVLVLRDSGNYAESLIEKLLPMMMLHFRIARENFKINSLANFEAFLNRGYNYYLIVANHQQDPHLTVLQNIVRTISETVPEAVILVFYAYPAYLVLETDMVKNHLLYQNLSYITNHATLFDTNRIHADNRLQVSSIYLYSLY